MRLHYLKYFKTETQEKWLFEKIKNDIFNFKIPKNIDYDTYKKLIYKIQKTRKKNNYQSI